MVKHSRRNIKHKKNSSRRNIKLKNPKHRKKRLTTFRKKPFNLRRSTLKKRQHGGDRAGQLATIRSLRLHHDNSPASTDGSHWTTRNNPFIGKSNAEYEALKAAVNTHEAQLNQPTEVNRKARFNRISQNIDNLEQQYQNNVSTGLRARLPFANTLPPHMRPPGQQQQQPPGQQQPPRPAPALAANALPALAPAPGQIGPVAAIAAAGNLGQQPAPANAQPQGQQPQGLAPAPGLGQQGGPAPGLAQQQPAPALAPAPGQIGPVAAIAAAGNLGQQPAPANALVANQVQAVNPGPAAVGQQQQGAPIVPANAPAGANQGPAAVNPGPAAAAGLPQTITINITTPPNTIRDLGGDAQLNQNNLAQVDISLAQLVQDFAR